MSNLINFYWDLDINELYKNIFRLRLARAISHFSIELNQGKNEYKKILKNQKKVRFPIKKLVFFKNKDIFYYLLTRLYDFMNLIRLKLLR